MINQLIKTETLERIELAQKQLRSYLTKANEQVAIIDSLLNQLDTFADEPVKNIAPKIVDDSTQPEPTYIARTIPWNKRDYRPLKRNVVKT